MKKKLTFTIEIQAPRSLVWKKMLDAEDYKTWTSAFCEGSYFTGSWEKDSKIDFLSPSGNGMTAIIADNRPYEYLSIKHLGEINKGVEDTTSEDIQAWAPAYENYEFTETTTGTKLIVHLDTMPGYEQYMLEAYPKALTLLKQMCESDSLARLE